MAILDFARPVSGSASVADRVRYLASHTSAMVAAWNDQRKTRNSLSQLSAHQLDDLGLSRGDIDRIAGSGRIF